MRPQASILAGRLQERRRFIQVVSGPRQCGKTTLVRQVAETVGVPFHYASADEPTLKGAAWLAQQWEAGRSLARDRGPAGAVLILDEIQKVSGWPEAIKRLWDEDTALKSALRVVLLGSAPLLLQRGLSESLAGRFEVIRLGHWSFGEMNEAFGWDLDTYLFFGGYPGSAPLIGDVIRWSRYILDSLIETTISRDVLLLTRVDKPALLRRLFELSCAYSSQVLSYQKMLGELQEAGNTTTLAHYLDLLGASGMVTGLQKFAGGRARRRGSSPKLQVLNTALLTAQSGLTPAAAHRDRVFWGRLVESAAGAHLANASAAGELELFYWRDRNLEVDFVASRGKSLTAIEVKSGASRDRLQGMDRFLSQFSARPLLVGGDGVPLGEFLSRPAHDWIG